MEASRTIKGRRKFVIIFLIIGKTECQFIIQIVTNRRKFPEDSDLQTRYNDPHHWCQSRIILLKPGVTLTGNGKQNLSSGDIFCRTTRIVTATA